MNLKFKKTILLTLVIALPIGLFVTIAMSDLNTSAIDTLTPYESSSELTPDGIADETAWSSAVALVVTTSTGTLGGTQVTIKAVYTTTNIYILASWADSTFSVTRDKYNVSGGAFNQGLDGSNSEDRIALLWEIGTIQGFNSSGGAVFCHDITSNVNFTNPGEKADMWHVKAARGGGFTSASITSALTIDSSSYEATAGTVSLTGYADDKFVDHETRKSDAGSGVYADNTNGTHAAWIEANPSDWIDAMILTQSEIDAGEAINITKGLQNGWANLTWAVSNYTSLDANVPRHILKTPAGSRGDIQVGMTWSDGIWTVEMKRALDTTNTDDDVIFNNTDSGVYLFSLAIMDNEGQGTSTIEHSTYSGPIGLTFTTPTPGPTPEPAIPGFDLFIVVGSFLAISIILIGLKSVRRKH